MARREPRDDARIRVVQVVAGEAHTLALTGILPSPCDEFFLNFKLTNLLRESHSRKQGLKDSSLKLTLQRFKFVTLVRHPSP